MRLAFAHIGAAMLTICATPPLMAGMVDTPTIERSKPDRLTIRWGDRAPVDVFQADTADAAPGAARLVSKNDRDGIHIVSVNAETRPYFLLRDTRSGQMVRVAERVLPLQQGSNLRDVGGYAAAGGKHVRWGMIYRSGGQSMLTEKDVQDVRDLGIANLVDLRSSEERLISPTRLDGIPYTAIGYSIDTVMDPAGTKKTLDPVASDAESQRSYRAMPTLLAPHLRVIFEDMLSKTQPLLYNCAAGQDRTGFVTAMILSALGVDRTTIYADYLLSTPSRRPQWEFAPIDDALAKTSPFAAMIAQLQKQPALLQASTLETADRQPFLASAFAEIDKRWGGVDAYLQKEVGLDQMKRAHLRARYLE